MNNHELSAVLPLSETCPLFLGAYGVVLKCRQKVRADKLQCNHLILLLILANHSSHQFLVIISCISKGCILQMKILCSTEKVS